MNKTILIGHLGRDAEVKHTHSGKSLVNFTLATSTKWNDDKGQKQERTDWHRCTAWGDRWSGVTPYLVKGQQVCVEGEVRYRDGEVEGKKVTYTDIHVDKIELLGAKGGDKRPAQRDTKPPEQQFDDDLPF